MRRWLRVERTVSYWRLFLGQRFLVQVTRADEAKLRQHAAFTQAWLKPATPPPADNCPHAWVRRRDGRECLECGRIEQGDFPPAWVQVE